MRHFQATPRATPAGRYAAMASISSGRYPSNKESSRPLFSARDILTKEKLRAKNLPLLQLSGYSVAYRVADALAAAAQLECPGVCDQFEGAV